ncbi:MAG: hypothetical protein AAF085_13075, partial [Planctomycetota bacterium]
MNLATTTLLATGLALTFAGHYAAASSTITVTDPAPLSGTGASLPIPTLDQGTIGLGSWQANGSTKSSTWFTPEGLGFDAGITISDIESFSFKTYKTTTGPSDPDWYLTIYTTPTTTPNANNG